MFGHAISYDDSKHYDHNMAKRSFHIHEDHLAVNHMSEEQETEEQARSQTESQSQTQRADDDYDEPEDEHDDEDTDMKTTLMPTTTRLNHQKRMIK